MKFAAIVSSINVLCRARDLGVKMITSMSIGTIKK
jgi:hypothetical protein